MRSHKKETNMITPNRRSEKNQTYKKMIEGETFRILRSGGFMGFRNEKGEMTIIQEDLIINKEKDINLKVDGELRSVPLGQMKELLIEMDQAQNEKNSKGKNS